MHGAAGVVYWLRADPSEVGALTHQEIECLEHAQVLVYGEFPVDTFLALVSEDCELICIGKGKEASGEQSNSAGEIAKLLLDRASQGKRVVRLHGGNWEEGHAVARSGIRFQKVVEGGSVLSAPVDFVRDRDSELFAERNTEGRPLSGLQLLLSRGEERAGDYATELEKLGATIAYAHCTELVSVTQAERDVVGERLATLQDCDWLFFSSANAIRYFFELAKGLNIDFQQFSGQEFAVVGEASARALSELGFSPALVASGKSGVELAQSLVEFLGERGPGTRVLFPRAKEGREEPGQLLRRAGLQCEVLPVYQSRPIFPPGAPLQDTLGRLERGELNGALFFAPSQLHALIGAKRGVQSQLAKLPVVAAIGQTTAAAIKAQGIAVQVVPEFPNPRLLAAAIANAFSSDY